MCKKIYFVAFILLLSIGLMAMENKDQTPTISTDVVSISQANNQMGFDLFHVLANSSENVCYSPYSLYQALGMVYVGARGATATEMEQVLHYPVTSQPLFEAFQNWQQQLQTQSQNMELQNANALFYPAELQLTDAFMQTNKTYFAARPQMYHPSENIVEKINAWVKAYTNGKIPQMLNSDPLGDLFLANAIYFHGDWKTPFNSQKTRPTDFFLANGKNIYVPTMTIETSFPYAENDDWQMLELPYLDENWCMRLLLPKQRGALSKLGQRIHHDWVDTLSAQLHPEKVTVFLPKFELKTSYQAKSLFAQLGLKTAFNLESDADFSGITGNPEYWIEEIHHKAVLTVDETGTEAAAATVVEMMRKSLSPVFRANHPFFFMLVEKETNTIMFMGKVMQP